MWCCRRAPSSTPVPPAAGTNPTAALPAGWPGPYCRQLRPTQDRRPHRHPNSSQPLHYAAVSTAATNNVRPLSAIATTNCHSRRHCRQPQCCWANWATVRPNANRASNAGHGDDGDGADAVADGGDSDSADPMTRTALPGAVPIGHPNWWRASDWATAARKCCCCCCDHARVPSPSNDRPVRRREFVATIRDGPVT